MEHNIEKRRVLCRITNADSRKSKHRTFNTTLTKYNKCHLQLKALITSCLPSFRNYSNINPTRELWGALPSSTTPQRTFSLRGKQLARYFLPVRRRGGSCGCQTVRGVPGRRARFL